MSYQTTSPSTAGARRSSTASETTLVDMPSRKVDVSKKDLEKYDDRKPSLDACSTSSQTSSSSRPSIMRKAIDKVKSKLEDKSPASAFEPKKKQSTVDMYPDTAYMWRALAESKI